MVALRTFSSARAEISRTKDLCHGTALALELEPGGSGPERISPMRDCKGLFGRVTYGESAASPSPARCRSCGLITGGVGHGRDADCVKALLTEIRLLKAAAGRSDGPNVNTEPQNPTAAPRR